MVVAWIITNLAGYYQMSFVAQTTSTSHNIASLCLPRYRSV